MINNFRKIKKTTLLMGLFFLVSSLYAADNSTVQNSTTNNSNSQLVNGNTADYDTSNVVESNANYKKAAQLYAELAIIYSHEGYLNRAKDKLIQAQNLAENNDYDLPIVGYAAGYYYQMIGANLVADKYYSDTLDSYPKNFEAMNFYGQFLCRIKNEYSKAKKLFDKSLLLSNNNDMAETFFLYSQCAYKQGNKKQALVLMERADKFRKNYFSAKLNLAEMYFEQKEYKKCYKTIYSMKDNKEFFNNRKVLQLRLKLAEYANNKNEEASVKLILSSENYNDDDMNEFFFAPQNGLNNAKTK